MTNCPYCGAPSNVLYVNGEGDVACLPCGGVTYENRDPLPPCTADGCDCRGHCTGHQTKRVLREGARKMWYCRECSVTEKEEAVGS